jgi:hypothetical protein
LEVDVQQGNFKIIQLLPQVLILFLVEKWIPLTRSETAEIGKKTEEILGVKVIFLCNFQVFHFILVYLMVFLKCFSCIAIMLQYLLMVFKRYLFEEVLSVS